MPINEGQIAFDGYRIVKSLEKNENNEIFLAERDSDKQAVVLKQTVLFNESSPASSKTGHEYDILKDLKHEGIPKVFEIAYNGKSIALVQEYINGSNLKEQIFKKRISVSDVLNIALQLSDILHYIHKKGIIHKDLNPRNIILTKEGNVKLIDFAISSNLHSETNDLLNIDQIEGTLNYISPEQTGRTAYSIKHHCDFYSFGILLYELLIGKPPYDSIDPLEIIHFHLSRVPTPLRSILPDLPDGLDQVISKLMEKNPDDRYQSALGLKADLEIIKEHFITKKPLIEFSTGIHDITGEYKQTQKLYGRKEEKKDLLNYYDNLSIVRSMLVLVAGYSGVGKSALIRHVKYPIIQKGGTFLSGKFDQFKQDIPYYAFIEGIEEFIRNLLSEPENNIENWKQKIKSVLGNNLGLIAEVIPLLSKIIKDYPEVPKLQPAEQESRFNKFLLDFIFSFSTTDKPLVIFLDDLQWADLSSLNLVKRIIENPGENSILILGAYRDNEVDKGHPLLITLKQIESSKNRIKNIQLQALDETTTCKITKDSLFMSQSQATDLGALVFRKTKGNPFFIHSFLKNLYDKELVKSETDGNWVWDNNEIDKLSYTDNVIDLMTERLIVLPYATQLMLKYAAVLGNIFKIDELSQLTEKSSLEIYNNLKPAIKEGYINSLDKRYRSLALSSLNQEFDEQQTQLNGSAHFTFTHDKVQQAAYNLIEISELAELHLRIGRLFLNNKKESQLHDGIFELLNHFALSLNLINNNSEKEKIASLCLIAGQKAKESISYDLGVRFLEMGKSLLGSGSWQSNYQLTYDIIKELGECQYLNNNPNIAEQNFKDVLRHAKTNFDKLKVYSVHTALYLKIGNSPESLRLGLEAVKLYGIRFPKNKKIIQISALLNLMKFIFLFSTKYKKPEDFEHIEDSIDEENIALSKLMIDLASSAYMIDQNLMMLVVLRIIKNYLKNGYTDASGWGFSGLSTVVLSALKLQKKGLDLWKLTIELNKKNKSPIIKWRLNYLVTAFGNPWRIPYRNDFANILDTTKACILNGDQLFTGYSVSIYQRYRFIAGINLKELIEGSEEQIPLIEKGLGGFDFFQCFHQMAKGISGLTNNNSWNDEHFNGDKELERIEYEGNNTKLGFFHTARLTSRYYFGKFDDAIQEHETVLKYKGNMLGELCEALYAFYTSLSISAKYAEMEKNEKRKYLKVFKTCLKDLKLWSQACPENHLQHYQLIQAELFAMKNDFENAIKFYEKSINTAIENKFKYVEAIANERAASLCYSKQLKKQSQSYSNEAWEAYHSWGATIKCTELENKYPELGKTKVIQKSAEIASASSVTSSSSQSALDLASVLKASQSIASQVKYVDLLKKLMHVIIENAGAERGCLLHKKGENLCIEAEGKSGNNEIKILASVPFKETDLVPHSFINYSWRSEESEVVNDAGIEERFNSDPYIKEHATLSMMCVPITLQGKITGLLYLENNLLKGVFNRDRINLLQMLSSQIGISIENSMLYENLEEKVVERTKEIEKQRVEIQLEKEKSDSLLLNILPKHAADELKSTGKYKAQSYKNVTVMFCDIVGFTTLGENMNADMLVNELHEFFSGVDDIMDKYGIEKIKTIGDAYLCAAGLDETKGNIPSINMVSASKEILDFLSELNQRKEKEGRRKFQIRIGIHTGPVTAGVVGKSKYAYDIWGDTVNTASRMESSGEPGKINISGNSFELVKEDFNCEYRGKISAKNKGEIDMYFVDLN